MAKRDPEILHKIRQVREIRRHGGMPGGDRLSAGCAAGCIGAGCDTRHDWFTRPNGSVTDVTLDRALPSHVAGNRDLAAFRTDEAAEYRGGSSTTCRAGLRNPLAAKREGYRQCRVIVFRQPAVCGDPL